MRTRIEWILISINFQIDSFVLSSNVVISRLIYADDGIVSSCTIANDSFAAYIPITEQYREFRCMRDRWFLSNPLSLIGIIY